MKDFNGKNLLLLGDSIMYGSGNGGFGVGEYLEKHLGVKLYKYCVGGARVGFRAGKDWVVEQVRRAVTDGIKPDIVVFDGFTNDCNMSDGVNCDVPIGENIQPAKDLFEISRQDSFSVCFESIVVALKKYFPKAEVLFVRPHKMGRRGADVQIEYGERAIKICKKRGIHVADIYTESDLDTFLPEHRDKYTHDSYNWGTGDCTHPNALGYEEKYMPIIEKKLLEL